MSSQTPNIKRWKCHHIRGDGKQVTFGFGHDFRINKLCIVEEGTGRKIAEMSEGLTEKELDLCARIIRQSPVMLSALNEAERRLWQAKHPNAIRLRQLIHSALAGLELPIVDESGYNE